MKQLHKLKAVGKLEELQYHEEDKIYEVIAKILSNYFELEDPLNLWCVFNLQLIWWIIAINSRNHNQKSIACSFK